MRQERERIMLEQQRQRQILADLQQEAAESAAARSQRGSQRTVSVQERSTDKILTPADSEELCHAEKTAGKHGYILLSAEGSERDSRRSVVPAAQAAS